MSRASSIVSPPNSTISQAPASGSRVSASGLRRSSSSYRISLASKASSWIGRCALMAGTASPAAAMSGYPSSATARLFGSGSSRSSARSTVTHVDSVPTRARATWNPLSSNSSGSWYPEMRRGMSGNRVRSCASYRARRSRSRRWMSARRPPRARIASTSGVAPTHIRAPS